MTARDPNRRGDPTSRPEGVFSHVLKALFGKDDEDMPRPDAPVAAGPPQPRHPIAEAPLERFAPEASAPDRPSREPMFMAFEELQALHEDDAARETEDDEPIAASTDAAAPDTHAEEIVPERGGSTGDEPLREVASIELQVLETFEEVSRQLREERPAASIAVEEPEISPVTQAEEPAPQVLADLHSPSVDTRRKTLERLALEPESAPVVAVAARLQDPSPEVRLAAVAVLEAMHDEAVLLLLLDAMRDPSEDVRRAARDTIGSRRSDDTLAILRRELAVPARRWAAAKILADLGEVDELVRAAAGEDLDVRNLVREAMDEAGTTAQLVEELADGRSDRRRMAAERLGQMRIRDAVDALIERLEDPDRGVRIKAAEALGRIGEQRASHALKKAFIWDPDSGVVVAIGNAIRKLAGTQAGRTIQL